MQNLKVLSIGGSRNIGYLSSIRLLDLGATVTFLLRSPKAFDNDETIQKYVRAGKARLVQGDALVKEDVKRAWAVAAEGEDGRPVDFLLFTLGGKPQLDIRKGAVIIPPNLVTHSLLNVLATIPSPRPKIIALSAAGLTRSSRKKIPLALKPVYGTLLTHAHEDKCGAEEVIAYSAGWSWEAVDSPGEEILGGDWKAELPAPGTMKSVMVIRPALLTDGACKAESTKDGKEAYRAVEGDTDGVWTVSRKDVSHFIVEKVMRRWDEWEGKRVTVAY